MTTVKSHLSSVKKGEIDNDSFSRLNERVLVNHGVFLPLEHTMFVYNNAIS